MNFVLHVVIDRPEKTSNRNFLMQFFSTDSIKSLGFNHYYINFYNDM